MPNGEYLVSHDYFEPGTNYDTMEIFQSKDRGKTWTNISTIIGQWWSTLFNHDRDLYVLGTSREYGNPVIRKSLDDGFTWTDPVDENTGKLSSSIGPISLCACPHSLTQWIEGNVVITPENTLVNILRSNLRNLPKERIDYGEDKAAVLHISGNGKNYITIKIGILLIFPGAELSSLSDTTKFQNDIGV